MLALVILLISRDDGCMAALQTTSGAEPQCPQPCFTPHHSIASASSASPSLTSIRHNHPSALSFLVICPWFQSHLHIVPKSSIAHKHFSQIMTVAKPVVAWELPESRSPSVTLTANVQCE
jgi:hypothetical protein